MFAAISAAAAAAFHSIAATTTTIIIAAANITTRQLAAFPFPNHMLLLAHRVVVKSLSVWVRVWPTDRASERMREHATLYLSVSVYECVYVCKLLLVLLSCCCWLARLAVCLALLRNRSKLENAFLGISYLFWALRNNATATPIYNMYI